MSKVKTVGVALSLATLIGLGAAACSVEADAEKADAGTDTTIYAGLGSQDATADGGVPVLEAPDAIGVSYITIPVTNNASGRSNYFIEVAIESADGATQYETTSAFLSGVEPGQSASAQGMVAWGTEPAPSDATVRVTTVQRTAST